MKKAKILGVAALALAASLSMASAATVTIDFEGTKVDNDLYVEDGYSFTPVTLDQSNHCVDQQCIHLNGNDETVMTRLDHAAFTLLSFVFNFQGGGQGNSFEVTDGTKTVTFYQTDYAQQNFWTYNFADMFADVSKITFVGLRNANVRIDDIIAISAVPLPASGLLLAGAVGAAGLLRRRRNRAV